MKYRIWFAAPWTGSSPDRATSNAPFATGGRTTFGCERDRPLRPELHAAPRAHLGGTPPLARLVHPTSESLGDSIRHRAHGNRRWPRTPHFRSRAALHPALARRTRERVGRAAPDIYR